MVYQNRFAASRESLSKNLTDLLAHLSFASATTRAAACLVCQYPSATSEVLPDDKLLQLDGLLHMGCPPLGCKWKFDSFGCLNAIIFM